MVSKRIIVHRFSIGDVEDPDLYAADPLIKWEQSEKGKWVMSRAIETPTWHRCVDQSTFLYCYYISAVLTEVDLTVYYLKWA